MKAGAVMEKVFQAQVLDLAHLSGWLCYHTHNSRRSAPGFPDLVLVAARGSLRRAEDRDGQSRVRAKCLARGAHGLRGRSGSPVEAIGLAGDRRGSDAEMKKGAKEGEGRWREAVQPQSGNTRS